jgi:uncharacterized membrane protein
MKSKDFDVLENTSYLKMEHPTLKSPRTFGQKSADNLTKWAGSWYFILGFLFFLVGWILLNFYWITQYKLGNPFDPYPFILLNLILSCLAAIQAPIILMSQNREAQKDRLRAQYDYAVNKKAEKEIRLLQKELSEIKKIILGKRG